jgi:16S rRNA G966 N2-methylase RsmD
MLNKKIFYDKLFPWKQGINRYSLHMDYECVSFITIPRDSEKIVELISEKLEKYGTKKKDITIVDGTACVGGDTISFCSNFGIVIPIEIDDKRYEDLLHNIKIYSLSNAYPIHGDCLEKIPEIQIDIDVIYLDPSWGGPDYKLRVKLELTLGDKKLDEAVKILLKDNVKLIVMKLPKNYDYDKLFMDLAGYNVTINRNIKKIDILMVEKM